MHGRRRGGGSRCRRCARTTRSTSASTSIFLLALYFRHHWADLLRGYVSLLVTMFVVDGRPFCGRMRRLDLTRDVMHSDDAALTADLERRLGGETTNLQVNE